MYDDDEELFQDEEEKPTLSPQMKSLFQCYVVIFFIAIAVILIMAICK